MTQSNSNDTTDEQHDNQNDLRGLVEDLADRVAALEDERDDLRDQLQEEREARREAEARIDELEEEVETNSETRRARGRDLAEINARISSVEEKIDATEAVESGEADMSEDLTPMEQIARLPEHVAAEQFDNQNHRNTFRARSVVRDFGDYARKTPRGYVLKNAELCRILTAQEDSKVESKTGERVMERIEDLSKGTFEHVVPSENNHREHILVLEDAQDLNLGSGTVVS